MRFKRFEKTIVQKENERKLNIIYAVWELPAFILLFVDYQTFHAGLRAGA